MHVRRRAIWIAVAPPRTLSFRSTHSCGLTDIDVGQLSAIFVLNPWPDKDVFIYLFIYLFISIHAPSERCDYNSADVSERARSFRPTRLWRGVLSVVAHVCKNRVISIRADGIPPNATT